MINLNTIGFTHSQIREVELELTGICNLNCPLCAKNYKSTNSKLLTPNIRSLESIISQLDSFHDLEYVCLSGISTEPTTFKDLFGLVDYLNSRDIKIELYTNGDLHTSKYWEDFGKLFVKEKDLVVFTVCGSTQELHEKYRVGSSLEKVLSSADSFRKYNITKNDRLQYILFEYNKNDFNSPDYKNILKQFSGVQHFNNNNQYTESAAYNYRFNMIDGETDIDTISERNEKYKTISKIGEAKKKIGNCELECKSLTNRFVDIDQYGNIFPCHIYRMLHGNIPFNTKDYSDILNFKYDSCIECEKFTLSLLKKNDFTRMI